MRAIAALFVVPGLVCAGLAVGSVDAGETREAEAADVPVVEVYSAPQPISRKPPRYPRGEQHMGNEAWVQVNFMKDGLCIMELIGDPGTRFRLIRS